MAFFAHVGQPQLQLRPQGGVQAANNAQAPQQGAGAPNTPAEDALIVSLRNVLRNEHALMKDFTLRHTNYTRTERFFNFITFGHAFSDVKAAYELEQRQAELFADAVMAMQTCVTGFEPNTEGQFTIPVYGTDTVIQISQDAAGRLSAKIGSATQLDQIEAFELPFTASTLSNKMVRDMVTRPESYPPNALLRSIETDAARVTHPLRREVYEEILSAKVGLSPENVSMVSNMALRTLTLRALHGEFPTRQAALDCIDVGLAHMDMMQEVLNINDEQAAALTENLEQELVANAQRVADRVDVSVLTRTNPTLSDADRVVCERNNRIHDCIADIILNREASVHDAHLNQPGERLRETLLQHADTFVEILEGDEHILDSFGEKAADVLREALVLVQARWQVEKASGASPQDGETFVRGLSTTELRAMEVAIDLAVDTLCDTIVADQVHKAIEGMRGPTLPTTDDILAATTSYDKVETFVKANLPLFMDLVKTEGALSELSQIDKPNGILGSSASLLFAMHADLATKEPKDLVPAIMALFAASTTVLDGIAEKLTTSLGPNGKYEDLVGDLRQRVAAFRNQTLEEMMSEAFDPNCGYGKLITDVMEHYFDTTGPATAERAMDRRGMAASYLRYTRYSEPWHEDPSQGAALGAVFKGAGPILQKELQGLNAANLNEDFKDAIADMKSALAAIDPKFVQAQLLDIVQRSQGKIAKIEVMRSLGAASIGQAFLCKVTDAAGEERTCVLKLLRPDVRNRAMRERTIFEYYAAQIPGMTDTFAGKLEGILAELDFTVEARNAGIGKIYEDEHGNPKRLESMSVCDMVDPSPGALLLELAPGKDLAKVKTASDQFLAQFEATKAALSAGAPMPMDNIREMAQHIDDLMEVHSRLSELARRWLEEAIFEEGFYHGDLHSGNIMIDMPDRATQPDAQVGAMTVIDYGNATILTKDQQKQVMVAMAGATFGKPDWFMDGYYKLLDEDGKAAFDAANTVNRSKEGYLLDAVGRRVKGADGEFLTVKENGLLENGKPAPGRLTLMAQLTITMGDATDASLRIAVLLKQLQEQGIACPAPIFNFSSCQIRLQNAVDGITDQILRAQKMLKDALPTEEQQTAQNYSAADKAYIAKLNAQKYDPDTFVYTIGMLLANRKSTFVRNVGFGRGIEAAWMMMTGRV